MQFVVKNVPPHEGGAQEDLICSKTADAADRFTEIKHINDDGEKGNCNEPYDKNGDIFQHRIFEYNNGDIPEKIYMWVEFRINYNTPKELRRCENDFHGLPVYEYSETSLMRVII